MRNRQKTERGGRRRRSSGGRLRRRLGPIEYTLLVLIVVGIAITIGMAILDPSA
jgi:hypothetical protein